MLNSGLDILNLKCLLNMVTILLKLDDLSKTKGPSAGMYLKIARYKSKGKDSVLII